MSDDSSRLVYVLPRVLVRNDDPQTKMVAVGKAQFWPDEDEIWADVVRKPRPSWLDVYRELPSSPQDEPEVARGTLLVSDDDDFLAEHVARAVAVLYVLGQPWDNWKTPAEAFQYAGFPAKTIPGEGITFVTKHKWLVERGGSLMLFPSLELRGPCPNYLVGIAGASDTEARRASGKPPSPRDLNAELVRRFESNPDDRIVAACYHLFRSRFSNLFTSPWQQDYAAYCACLEAALDIDGSQRDVAITIAARLAELYPELPDLESWIRGLYIERSLFVHGASRAVRDRYKQDIARFRGRKGAYDVLGHLCLGVIHDSLHASLDRQKRDSARLNSEPYTLMRKMLTSDAHWREVVRHFCKTGSVDKILAYKEEARSNFIRVCYDFSNSHGWEFVTTPVDEAKVFKVLEATAYAVVKCVDASKEEQNACSKLVEAAESSDVDQVRA